jgi:methylenetetrahydrofolate dehydrogenase (NADP+)/methenyltetrahydrofolate cyclohydrolase
MPAQIIDGKAIAAEVRAEVAKDVKALQASHGLTPGLAVVLVGEDPASQVYVRNKAAQTVETGMQSFEYKLPVETSEYDILALVARLNANKNVNGILVQLPLPKGMRPNAIASAVDPAKDVDGLHPLNAGRLLLGEPCLAPCTPLGIMKLLERFEVPLAGANAVVIGRSNIVGKPIALLLLQAHASVTICHSRTRDLAEVCRRADVLVAAVGSPRLVRRDWVKPGAAVIDVGVGEVDGELVGDVDTEGVRGVAALVTPHRRGVGPLTITLLLYNTLAAHRARCGA